MRELGLLNLEKSRVREKLNSYKEYKARHLDSAQRKDEGQWTQIATSGNLVREKRKISS